MNKHVPPPEQSEPPDAARAEVLRKAELARQRLFAPITEQELAERLAKSRAQAEAGQLIPLEDVVTWVRSWGTDNELPPPTCK